MPTRISDLYEPCHDAPHRRQLLRLFQAGLAAVDGRRCAREALSSRPIEGPVRVCAVGKAAEAMALGACGALGPGCTGGLVITKPGHADADRLARLGLETFFGGHPVPDRGSLDAGEALGRALDHTPLEIPWLFLISGGASSLLERPIPGLGLAELVKMNQWLLASGLPIGGMNLMRKSVSMIKAGGLLRLIGGRRARALAISDVPGDILEIIGSGPLTPEADLAVKVGRLDLPDWLTDWVARGLDARGTPPETGPEIELVATLSKAKAAVADEAARLGIRTWLHEEVMEGDAEERGRALAQALLESDPGLHVWGGETTLRLPESPGRGGRCQHLALAAAVEIAGRDDGLLLSAGTDGTDGPTGDAGALVDGRTLERGEMAGYDAVEHLRRADSGAFLEASGDLIRTGPTGTNVMDLILGLKT